MPPRIAIPCRITPLRAASACLLIALALTAAACGAKQQATGGWSESDLMRAQNGAPIQVMPVNSQLGVGPNRLAFGLISSDGSLVQDATGTVQLFRLQGDEAIPGAQYELRPSSLREPSTHRHDDGTLHVHNDPIATMYVANVEFPEAGTWGAALDVTTGGKTHALRTRIVVAERTQVPMLGEKAPPSKQLTLRDVSDIAEIDSSRPPRPELHDMTVAEAIASGRPSVVAFATPAFCQTRFCGPVVEAVVAPLAQHYAGRVNVLHIEPFQLAEARKGHLVPIPVLEEWGLTSEPYVFVLDRQGRVFARFEGIMEYDEVAAALDRALSAPAG